MALQFYSAGFFDPRNAEQALACMDMMDFDRKDMVMQRIARSARQYRQALAAAALAAPEEAPEETPEERQAPQRRPAGKAGLRGEKQEPYATRTARQRVAESTNPT